MRKSPQKNGSWHTSVVRTRINYWCSRIIIFAEVDEKIPSKKWIMTHICGPYKNKLLVLKDNNFCMVHIRQSIQPILCCRLVYQYQYLTAYRPKASSHGKKWVTPQSVLTFGFFAIMVLSPKFTESKKLASSVPYWVSAVYSTCAMLCVCCAVCGVRFPRCVRYVVYGILGTGYEKRTRYFHIIFRNEKSASFTITVFEAT
jgi:hypothetical protein